MAWLDTAIVGAIVVLGLVVMYRALKEPMDMIGGGIKRGAIAVIGMFKGEGNIGVSEITYG